MAKVSVIMAVYNTEKYLLDSIESILNQDFIDFEFIILNDGSTDGSAGIITNYASKDKRIRYYFNDTNKGISFTRNRLISLTETNFIITQDSDDISLNNRILLEYEFLKDNKEYSAVSGNNLIIDEDGNIIGKRDYSDDIRSVILKKNPLSNPSSMFRKDVFEKVGGYEDELNYGEDYDLWMKMYNAGYKLKNLDSYLIKLRIRKGQTKSSKLKKTLLNTINIQNKYIKLGLKPTLTDRIYNYLEKTLLILPDFVILFLFKNIEYKGK